MPPHLISLPNSPIKFSSYLLHRGQPFFKVFTGVVKIRKGMAAKLILDTKSTGGLHKWFYHLAKNILRCVCFFNVLCVHDVQFHLLSGSLCVCVCGSL